MKILKKLLWIYLLLIILSPISLAQSQMDPGGIPHYFGPYGNWAYSPLPRGPIGGVEIIDGGTGYTNPTITIVDAYGTGTGATAVANVSNGAITSITITNPGSNYTAPVVVIEDPTGIDALAIATLDATQLTGGIRKFVDSLPGLGSQNVNNLGLYLPIAVPDTTTYPGSDYYEIELREFDLKLHSDLPPTRLRGYVQVKDGVDVTPPSYAGPIIIAQKDRPVRIKFTNKLPTGAGGNLFIPVDKTVMGAGTGPLVSGMGRADEECMMNPNVCYTENRATIHLHGNNSAWISDGTPHQWITPAGENTPYKRGISAINVPDMPDPGDGSMTFYYTNAQSARLMFYHDHSYGITRLNVYVGEAAGYLVTDPVEQDLINGTNNTGVNPNGDMVLPDLGIPLIIQDKTFVDADTIAAQDPTWAWGTTPPVPNTGDLWYPHVYMPAQNPYDPSGMNAFGRWHYAPWFWPPITDLNYPPIDNPYYDPTNAPWEPPVIPATPNPSMPGEAFMDTPTVNGVPYPYIEVEPKAYRFRILNAANDRFFNLQLYVAVDKETGQICDGTVPVDRCTEVKMVPAVKTAGFPKTWPTDGREGGVPDPGTKGPDWIQIGTEGGFLPEPVIVKNQPITWNLDPTTFNFGNVELHSLLLGTAERADVIVDFSQFAGKTLIVYNDAPAAFPAGVPVYDFYTNNPSQIDVGGAPSTMPGYGPNTRTIMQIRVKNTNPDPPYDFVKLQNVFKKTPTKPSVFELTQDQIIIPQSGYNSAYNANFQDKYIRQFEDQVTFTTIDGRTVTIPIQSKAIQDEMGEAYDVDFGRMSSMLGLELPGAPAGGRGFILYPFISPPVDLFKESLTGSKIGELDDGTQIWRITHNGVDTHAIHVHLFNAQLINRVAWDGAIIPPDPNELGWKETFRVNPLEHTIIAFRPVKPNLPFDVPNSVRLIDPTKPENAPLMGPPGGFKDPNGLNVNVLNHYVNFGWEYVYHCHLLAHEEMDMMHATSLAVKPKTPTILSVSGQLAPPSMDVTIEWTKSIDATGYVLERAEDSTFTTGLVTFSIENPDTTTYKDTIQNPTAQNYFYRIYAKNVVGDVQLSTFPLIEMNSDYSNIMAVNQYQITVQATGSGSGSINSSPAGINYNYPQNNIGYANFTPGSTITLTATADTGSTVAWTTCQGITSGNGTQTATCTFNNLDGAKTAVATFTLNQYQVIANATGNGSGSISSNPAGIIFSYPTNNTGSSNFNHGTTVTLTATADTGSTVAWTTCQGITSGNGTQTATCTFNNLDGAKTAVATFTLNQYQVIANATGNGSGSISSNPAGIIFSYPTNNTGSSNFNHGTTVTLTATADTGSTVAWTTCQGITSGNGTQTATCTFNNLDGAKTAVATFTLNQYQVIANATGNGSGSISSNPAGIIFSYPTNNTGSSNFNHGTTVTLTATADTGSTVAWTTCQGITSGNGTQTATCTFNNLDGAKIAEATFTLQYTITVTKSGAGTGNVTAGSNCNLSWNGSIGTCKVNHGTTITLSGSPDIGSSFVGWSNGSGSAAVCTGSADCTFTITQDSAVTATFEPVTAIKVVYPNGGEILASGSSQIIKWVASANMDHFTIQFSKDNGASWNTIATNVKSGYPYTYNWTVPALTNNNNRCLIRVIGYSATNVRIGADRSDAPFTIEVVKLTAPNGGETLYSGQLFTITWATNQTRNPVSRVTLSYTLNGGLTWTTIGTVPGNPGSYLWTVPAVSTTRTGCMIRIVLRDSAGNTVGSDMSDTYFTIRP
jgi:FtsP/CotA-like multicopper oxidase with cupredoxin domain